MAGQRTLQLRLDWGPVSLPFIRALQSQQIYGTEKRTVRRFHGWSGDCQRVKGMTYPDTLAERETAQRAMRSWGQLEGTAIWLCTGEGGH